MENKNVIEKYFYPMSVSSFSGTQDKKEDILSRWDKFDTLSEQEKSILISPETAKAIKIISLQFNFSQKEAEEISRIVRSFYFHEITKEKIVFELNKKLPSISDETTQKIGKFLSDKIFNHVARLKEEQISSSVAVSLPVALKQYPNIGEQRITASQLKLKYFPDPVKPSIKNWITDFHDNMGSGKHSSIDRGNYLFHSENGKKLTTDERQKLSIILKSLEEGNPLAIDPERGAVIFENITTETDLKNNRDAQMHPEKPYAEQIGQTQASSAYSPNFLSKLIHHKSAEIAEDSQKSFADMKSEGSIKTENIKKDQFEISQKIPQTGDDNYFSNFASSSFDKKQTNKSDVVSDVISSGGSVSFSSPQKFSVEQGAISPQKETPKADQQKPNTQENPFSNPQRQALNKESQWHIKPAGYYREEIGDNEEGGAAKISGNIIDLKN